MEEIFEEINFKIESFDFDYFDTYQSRLTRLICQNDDESNDKNREIFNSMEILFTATNKALENFNGDFEIQSDVEIRFFILFEKILNELKSEILLIDDFVQIVKIFELIVRCKKTTLFNIKAYSGLMKRIFKDQVSIEKFQSLEILIKTMFVKLEFNFLKHNNEDQKNRIRNYKREIYNYWRFSIETFLEKLTENILIKNITIIQELYE